MESKSTLEVYRKKSVWNHSKIIGVFGAFKSESSLPILPPADEEGRVKIWSSYSNCLDPDKEVPSRQDGIGDLRSWI